ncbi:hypothetical protein DFH11DRAFT_1550370 [Phellopilus nigrolimitatus]|nr:hypothetical protein DFH11DRAFT_1550370 [Phellopilus nigrolimitatus]
MTVPLWAHGLTTTCTAGTFHASNSQISSIHQIPGYLHTEWTNAISRRISTDTNRRTEIRVVTEGPFGRPRRGAREGVGGGRRVPREVLGRRQLVPRAYHVHRRRGGQPRVQHRVQELQHDQALEGVRDQGAADVVLGGGRGPVRWCGQAQAQVEQGGGGGARAQQSQQWEEGRDARGKGGGVEQEAGVVAEVCEEIGGKGVIHCWDVGHEHLKDAREHAWKSWRHRQRKGHNGKCATAQEQVREGWQRLLRAHCALEREAESKDVNELDLRYSSPRRKKRGSHVCRCQTFGSSKENTGVFRSRSRNSVRRGTQSPPKKQAQRVLAKRQREYILIFYDVVPALVNIEKLGNQDQRVMAIRQSKYNLIFYVALAMAKAEILD